MTVTTDLNSFASWLLTCVTLQYHTSSHLITLHHTISHTWSLSFLGAPPLSRLLEVAVGLRTATEITASIACLRVWPAVGVSETTAGSSTSVTAPQGSERTNVSVSTSLRCFTVHRVGVYVGTYTDSKGVHAPSSARSSSSAQQRCSSPETADNRQPPTASQHLKSASISRVKSAQAAAALISPHSGSLPALPSGTHTLFVLTNDAGICCSE